MVLQGLLKGKRQIFIKISDQLPIFQFQQEFPNFNSGRRHGLSVQQFLPDLQEFLSEDVFNSWGGVSSPFGRLELRPSNSTSLEYSEDWVSGTIPAELTYRLYEAIINTGRPSVSTCCEEGEIMQSSTIEY